MAFPVSHERHCLRITIQHSTHAESDETEQKTYSRTLERSSPSISPESPDWTAARGFRSISPPRQPAGFDRNGREFGRRRQMLLGVASGTREEREE
jgi:hypothetical protein